MPRQPLQPPMRLSDRFGGLVRVVSLLLLDIAVLWFCIALMVIVRYALGGRFSPSLYLSLAWTPALYAVLAVLTKVNMPLQTPPEALKRISGAVSYFFLLASLFFFLTHEATAYSRLVFLASWSLSLAAVPLARLAASRLFPSLFFWRAPCVLVGAVEDVRAMAPRLEEQRDGLRLAALCLAPGDASDLPAPRIDFDDLPAFAAANPHCYAVLLANPCYRWPPADALERLSVHFRHVLLRSPQIDQLSTWTRGVRLGGMTVLTCQFKLLDPWRKRLKRVYDIAFCLTVGVVFLPVFAMLYLLIRLDSPGPAFFTQKRLGQGGRTFRIVKFRTMRLDAEEHLQKLLRENEALACQWRDNQKLQDDPRITRMGKWLRKTSIDELPQLFNVLLGSMSLVGPRPIVESEIAKYGEEYATFCRVRPGLTGLWQVSGRNNTDYAYRVALDVAYVRNWSLYMDIWILARTVVEVVRMSGR